MKRCHLFNTICFKFLLILILTVPFTVQADTSQFFYDPLGRLDAIVNDQGDGVIYQYDPVGNLLSITPLGAPIISDFSPQIFDAGTTTVVKITGSGLIEGSISSSNPDVEFSLIGSSGTTLSGSLTIANPTAFGATTLNVNTSKGVASIDITIRQRTPTITGLDPDDGVNGGVTVTIEGEGFGTKAGSNLVTFSGPGGIRLPADTLTESFTRLTVNVPVGVVTGSVTVQIAGVISNSFPFRALSLTDIISTASQGTPLDPTLPSANTGQLIQVRGSEFKFNPQATFLITDPDGVISFQNVPAFNISLDRTTADVIVPFNASTGPVTLTSSIGGQTEQVFLQIVPELFSFSPSQGETFTPGTVLSIFGGGFREGETTVTFTGAQTPAATLDVLDPQRLTVTIPPGATAGPLTVSTDGGTSKAIQVNASTITDIVSVADEGTPSDSTQPSATIRQLVTLTGSGFDPSTSIFFTAFNSEGLSVSIPAIPESVTPDGQSLTVFVGDLAVSGAVTVQDGISGLGSGSVNLQIVPILFSLSFPAGGIFSPGTSMTISGRGFKEGGTTVSFTGASAPVIVSDVLQDNTLLTVTIPPGATAGPLTVSTDGGTSNSILVNTAIITDIASTADLGTPADPTQASANIFQEFTLTGSGFTGFPSRTEVFFTGFDASGAIVSVLESPEFVDLSGLSLNIRIPIDRGIISGPVTVRDPITGLGSGSVNLQVVPTIDSVSVDSIDGTVTEGSLLTIVGDGFEPNNTQIQFPGVTGLVTADNQSIIENQGNRTTVIIPANVDTAGDLFVITSGGTSPPFNLSVLAGSDFEIEPNDTAATATLIGLHLLGSFTPGTLDPSGDIDYFRVNLEAFTQYNVEVIPEDASVPIMTISLTWLDQDGTTVLDSVIGSTDPLQIQPNLSITPFNTGFFYIRLEDVNNQGGPTHRYILSISPASGPAF